MTNTHKPIPDDQKAAENKTDASAELKDSQLDKVSGGALTSFSQAIKGLGDGLKKVGQGQ